MGSDIMKVGIYTLGCKVNTYESEFIINEFKKEGYEITHFTDQCDIYIINTCTVTNNSDLKSKKIINQTAKRKGQGILIVMGCFIQANQDYNNPDVDIIIGTKNKSKIISLVKDFKKTNKQIQRIYPELNNQFENMEIDTCIDRTRAFVKIQDGCENFCSYCIIPYVRGQCVSKESDLIISEITNLVRFHKEIVLTGIHIGNYGIDIGTNFAKLLNKIVQIPNINLIRISSIEVTEINNEMLEILAKHKNIANHLHIPIQSGCNKILKLMKRKYDLKTYCKTIKEIRKKRKDIAITTDIIVGFPGETKKDFQKTLRTCRKLRFTKIHVFPYSKRNNTAAFDMPNHVSDIIKKKRSRTLIKLSKKLELKYMHKHVNKKVIVLTENYKEGYTYGHTSNYLFVKIKEKLEHNELIEIIIESIDYPYVIGKTIKKY
jgi:threonylcarbamoyladenosine tRNA methylthiotransferase MtaB